METLLTWLLGTTGVGALITYIFNVRKTEIENLRAKTEQALQLAFELKEECADFWCSLLDVDKADKNTAILSLIRPDSKINKNIRAKQASINTLVELYFPRIRIIFNQILAVHGQLNIKSSEYINKTETEISSLSMEETYETIRRIDDLVDGFTQALVLDYNERRRLLPWWDRRGPKNTSRVSK